MNMASRTVHAHWPGLLRSLVLGLLGLSTLSSPAMGAAATGTLAGPALLQALRAGGLVIAMRHAHSPNLVPPAAQSEPDNLQHERQLDDAGRASATALGNAIRRLRVPVGAVYSSPTYRALQTLRLAALPNPQTREALGDAGQSMQSDGSGTRGAWLRAFAAQPPARGANTWIVTHFPNLTEAFPADTKGLGDGEALILKPDGHGGVALLARLRMEDWSCPELSCPTAP